MSADLVLRVRRGLVLIDITSTSDLSAYEPEVMLLKEHTDHGEQDVLGAKVATHVEGLLEAVFNLV